jgi:transcription termination/antitermination protein NusA
MEEGDKTAQVVVPDRQLSLAIGKEGQNARLAARLTGWRIDIKPQSREENQVEAGTERHEVTIEETPSLA